MENFLQQTLRKYMAELGGGKLLRGLYIAASGMIADEIRHSVVSNNLANANTSGYKKDVVIGQTFSEVLISCQYKDRKAPVGRLPLGAGVIDISTKTTPGMIENTGGILDLALDGDGFFVLETAQGERISRQGNFQLDREGYLQTLNGDRILGLNGPIRLDPSSFASEIKVKSDGSIYQGDLFVDRLSIVDYDSSLLIKEGNSRFTVREGAFPAQSEAGVIQGALERSNVNVIEEMVNMITLMRTYETEQKLVQAHNETLDKLINDLGANI
ncbi:MAG: flagellar hook-basal body complex protein [Firmicutes bacterium]|nr:flagellar hook-basal body complex protein [Bacillota bacterium]